jgi:hypothetical protein
MESEDPLVSTLRFLQSIDQQHGGNGVHPWADIQTKLRSSGMNIRYDSFKQRWENPQGPDDEILHQLVDRFDGHGLVLKTGEEETPQGSEGGPDQISQMAKRATDKALG